MNKKIMAFIYCLLTLSSAYGFAGEQGEVKRACVISVVLDGNCDRLTSPGEKVGYSLSLDAEIIENFTSDNSSAGICSDVSEQQMHENKKLAVADAKKLLAGGVCSAILGD
jgi:hypothetical protein